MGPLVRSVEIVHHRSLWEYRGDGQNPFLKITVKSPRDVTKVRDMSNLLVS
jgi:hypothetical protein